MQSDIEIKVVGKKQRQKTRTKRKENSTQQDHSVLVCLLENLR